MSVYSITNRYAKALLTQAEESNQFEVVGNDMSLIYETLEKSKELRVALESPVINEEKRILFLRKFSAVLFVKRQLIFWNSNSQK